MRLDLGPRFTPLSVCRRLGPMLRSNGQEEITDRNRHDAGQARDGSAAVLMGAAIAGDAYASRDLYLVHSAL